MASKDRVVAKTLKGFRDFHPSLAKRRKSMVDLIWQRAVNAGFEPIETPVLEYSETLLGSGGEETDKEVYLFEDHGGRKVGLRFDLTVPFSRYVAENQGTLIMPFKRVQIGNSYRGEKPQKGRYREFCQADFDIVGVDSLAADVEVIQNIRRSLEELIPVPFTIYVGHRVILSALIGCCLTAIQEDGKVAALIALDKLAKIGQDKVLELLLKLEGADEAGAKALLNVVTTKTDEGHTDLNLLKSTLKGLQAPLQEVARLEETLALLKEGAGSSSRLCLDLSIARGLGYYTGIVFETFVDELPAFGSVSSGGRYNGLVSRFSKQEIPGIGGSIGVDRLMAALEELGISELQEERQGYFVALGNPDARSYGFELVERIRSAGIKADLDLKLGKLAQQFKYADRRGFAKVVTIGDEELSHRTVSLKDLATGEEHKNLDVASFIEGL